jgi:glycosyltransferase involved in cell wall biosynthesis
VKILLSKYQLEGKAPIIGVISRYFELKGIQFIIPAFKKLLAVSPNAHLILANATGEYASVIQSFLEGVPGENYTQIRFEGDIAALYQTFDVFIHVPINSHIEAFGQTYVEALAAGVPSVFTLSGVAAEFIEHEKNALVVPFQKADAIYLAMMRLLEDGPLRSRLIEQGKIDVKQQFELAGMMQKLEELYAS